jgi:hypothetical protein
MGDRANYTPIIHGVSNHWHDSSAAKLYMGAERENSPLAAASSAASSKTSAASRACRVRRPPDKNTLPSTKEMCIVEWRGHFVAALGVTVTLPHWALHVSSSAPHVSSSAPHGALHVSSFEALPPEQVRPHSPKHVE